MFDVLLGPDQKRSTNWIDVLKIPNFKEGLKQFLLEAWNDNSLADKFQGKTLFTNCVDTCYTFTVHEDIVNCAEEHQLNLAITRKLACFIVYFSASHQKSLGPLKIVVRTIHADCLVIALRCFKTSLRLNSLLNLWLEVGLETKNTEICECQSNF